MEQNKSTAISTVLLELKSLGYFRIHDISREKDSHLFFEADGKQRNILLRVAISESTETTKLSKPERMSLQRKASDSDREPWAAVVNPAGRISWELVV